MPKVTHTLRTCRQLAGLRCRTESSFEDTTGVQRIKDRFYHLQDAHSGERIQRGQYFKRAFQPGRRLIKSAIFPGENYEEQNCPQCEVRNLRRADEEIKCECGMRYQRITTNCSHCFGELSQRGCVGHPGREIREQGNIFLAPSPMQRMGSTPAASSFEKFARIQLAKVQTVNKNNLDFKAAFAAFGPGQRVVMSAIFPDKGYGNGFTDVWVCSNPDCGSATSMRLTQKGADVKELEEKAQCVYLHLLDMIAFPPSIELP